jgi:methylglyoxal synthase
MNIALIAHDRLKDALVDIVADFAQPLALHRLMATRTTGERIRAQVGLDIECLLSGPLGGDLQIGARIATGDVDLMLFPRDPMTPQPHEPDIHALLRASDVHNIPCATSPASARIMLTHLGPHAPQSRG